MSRSLLHTAKELIPPSDGKTTLIHPSGEIQDIVREVLEAHQEFYRETDQFAKRIQGNNRKETFKNIWSFLRNEIDYKLDPPGEQFSKSPSRIISDGFSDCKGYSIFTGSVLENLQIPYFFRFVDFAPMSKEPTHVYVVGILEDGKEYPIDACWQFPGKQKTYTYKQDENPMTRISRLSGIDGNILEGNLKLDLMLERLRLEQEIFSRISGSADQYAAHIRQIQAVRQDPTLLFRANVSGIGDFFRKVKTAIQKGLQAFKKAITAPQKAFAELFMKTLLPQASPFFLYLFIKDPAQVSQLPAKAKAKRDKAVRVARAIINGLGMEESTFMAAVRNGIMKQLNQTPEQMIQGAFQGNISGIGIAWGAVIQTVIGIITKIVNLFKGEKINLSTNDAPDLKSDFEGYKPDLNTNPTSGYGGGFHPSLPGGNLPTPAGPAGGNQSLFLLLGLGLLLASGK